jgi:hypothetical protein
VLQVHIQVRPDSMLQGLLDAPGHTGCLNCDEVIMQLTEVRRFMCKMPHPAALWHV